MEHLTVRVPKGTRADIKRAAQLLGLKPADLLRRLILPPLEMLRYAAEPERKEATGE